MRKTNFIFSLLLVVILYISINGEEPSWHIKLQKIKALKTSKNDVEELFRGLRITQSSERFGIKIVDYETPDGDLAVQYSTGICAKKDLDSDSYFIETYKVEKDIVLNVLFFPKEVLKFSKFKVNKSQIIKMRKGHDSAIHYIDKQQNIDYSITAGGKVAVIKLFIPAELNYLKCSANP